jgi:simple sugar transport system permease protein
MKRLDVKSEMRRFLNQTELYLFLVIVVVTLMIQMLSGQFYTPNNITDILRSLIIPGLFSIGVMMVIVSGGVDVSFPAIGALAMYVVVSVQRSNGLGGSVFLGYIAAMSIGFFVGMLNGFIIAKYNMPTLIVSLGTSSLCIGIMQGVLKGHEIPLPANILAFGKLKFFTAVNGVSGLTSDMPITFSFLVIAIGIAYVLLNHTMLGRSIYAVGGDSQAASRAGFDVFFTQMFLYSFVGALAGFAGYTRAIVTLNCQPVNLIGTELNVIAGVVLGGVRITGGIGTLKGTILGTLLLTTINNSLIMLGIPTIWQSISIAVFILVGTGISSIQTEMVKKNRMINFERYDLTRK